MPNPDINYSFVEKIRKAIMEVIRKIVDFFNGIFKKKVSHEEESYI